jgi:hypothetical protein
MDLLLHMHTENQYKTDLYIVLRRHVPISLGVVIKSMSSLYRAGSLELVTALSVDLPLFTTASRLEEGDCVLNVPAASWKR